MDPIDSIPFADEDFMDTVPTSCTTVTSQAVTVLSDGHRNLPQEVPRLVRLLDNDAEISLTLSDTADSQNGGLAVNSTNYQSTSQPLRQEVHSTSQTLAAPTNEEFDSTGLEAGGADDRDWQEGEAHEKVNGHEQHDSNILAESNDSGSQTQGIAQQLWDCQPAEEVTAPVPDLDIIRDIQTRAAEVVVTAQEECWAGVGNEGGKGDPSEHGRPSLRLSGNMEATASLAATEVWRGCEENATRVSPEEVPIAAVPELKVDPSTERGMQPQHVMDSLGKTHGDRPVPDHGDLMDNLFNPSHCGMSDGGEEEVENPSSQSIHHVEEGREQTSHFCRTPADMESSPEIVVGRADSMETVTLKDATSEKAELASRGDGGSPSTQDSRSSTSEDKRRSSGDLDLDFAVLETESHHLNLDISKQRTSLCKKGSLARRKKPSRGSVNQTASDSSDSMFQDSTDAKPLISPTSDMAEDEVFDRQAKVATESPQRKLSSSGEGYTVRKAAQPFKPSVIMPGLQDLSKSKLFNQERTKTECPSSPTVKSAAHQPAPPQVLPKPSTKLQKDFQNHSIAAENLPVSAEDRIRVSAGAKDTQTVGKDVSSEPTKPCSDSGFVMGPQLYRMDSWSSVSGPRTMSRRDSTSSVESGDMSCSPACSAPRRASIQGSAYTPIGFRPRRSSSIVLDSNSKLVDLSVPLSPVPVSPTPVSPALVSPAPISPAPSPAALEREVDAVSPAGGRSPSYTIPPVWLSEMKVKAESAAGELGAVLSTTSMGSNDGGAVASSSSQSALSSDSRDRAQGHKVPEQKASRKQEDDAERLSWVKAAQQRPENVPSEDVEENGDEEDGKKPVPPWAGDLKKKSRPFVTPRIKGTAGDSVDNRILVGASDRGPAVSLGADNYSPSWMKGRKPPPPAVPSKPCMSGGSKAGAGTTADNPMKQYETPQWKLALAEKKKLREAGMVSVEELGPEGDSDLPADSTVGSSVSVSTPQWKQQLSLRKKLPQPDVGKEAEDGGPGPNWAKQTEERRARLLKTGLFEQAEATEES